MSGGLRQKITEPSELVNEFSKLYCDLIANLYNVKCAKFLDDVKRALKDMRRLKYEINERHKRDFYFDINYQKPAERCAYLYAYSVLNTNVVYSEFTKHLTNNEEVLQILFSKKKLKICCLAGGPATEAVAITKAISDFSSKSPSASDLYTDIEVTVVDIVPDWQTEGKALIDAVNKSSNLFNSKTTRFHYNFYKADLLSPFEKILQEKIAEADIVTVVKFGSSIEEKSERVCLMYHGNMLKSVMDCMYEKSCLFMLDTAGGKVFRHTMNVVWNQRNANPLELSLFKKYRLLAKTLQKMEAAIDFRTVGESSTLFPTVFTTISSCFWIKDNVMF